MCSTRYVPSSRKKEAFHCTWHIAIFNIDEMGHKKSPANVMHTKVARKILFIECVHPK